MTIASKLLDQIALSNEISEDLINERASEVGIFWIKEGKLIAINSCPKDQGEDDSMFVNYPRDHYTTWRDIKRMEAYPDLKSYGYDDVARGRVIYNKDESKYYAFGPTKLISTAPIQSQILRTFNISKKDIVFMGDHHYNTYKVS